MKAPHHERASLLGAAIERATDALQAPIDRVEVQDGRIVCAAGDRAITLSYQYAQGGELDPATGRFTAFPGSGSWAVEIVDDRLSRHPEKIGLGLAKFLKRRGW